MKLENKIIVLLLLLTCFFSYSQKNELYNLRLNYVKIWYKNEFNQKAPSEDIVPSKIYSNQVFKFFKIPLKEKLKLFPFNQFDSIYITKLNYLRNIEEERDYLDSKFHRNVQLLSKKQIKKLSNNFF